MSRRSLLLVGTVALFVRLGYVIAFMRGYSPNSDADTYFQLGRAVADGHGYVFSLPFEFVHATAGRPPLYPTVLAGAFHVFGTHVGVAQGVNVIVGSVAAVLGALIGDRIGGARAGLCSGLVVALYPPVLANDVTVLTESIAVALVFTVVLLLYEGRTVWAAVAAGLLMLDRASAQWFLVAIAGWVLWRFGWRPALRLVVIALLVVSPWVVRNAVHVGGPVLVTTNGFNLNAVYSNEARISNHFVDANFDPRFAAMRARAVDEVDFDNQLRRKALRDLRSHPTRVVQVVRTNLANWLELRPAANRDPERLDGRNLSVRDWTLPFFYLVTIAGIFALVRARRSAAAQLLAMSAAYFSLVSMFSIAVPRLRSIFDACMAVAAGVTLAWAIDRRVQVNACEPRRRPVDTRLSAAVLVLLIVAVMVGGLAWRADTRRRAHRAVAAAVIQDEPAVNSLIDQYGADRSAHRPPLFRTHDVQDLQHLMTILGERAPQVGPTQRPAISDALRTARVALHEVEAIGLLSAAEYMKAGASPRTGLVEAVKTRYESEIRPGDASLEPWTVATSADALTRLRRMLDVLR